MAKKATMENKYCIAADNCISVILITAFDYLDLSLD